jgi:hypothetical protein
MIRVLSLGIIGAWAAMSASGSSFRTPRRAAVRSAIAFTPHLVWVAAVVGMGAGMAIAGAYRRFA